jgi:hypothetical protein
VLGQAELVGEGLAEPLGYLVLLVLRRRHQRGRRRNHRGIQSTIEISARACTCPRLLPPLSCVLFEGESCDG